MTITHTPISDFQCSAFSALVSGGHEVAHEIYSRGSGAPVVLIQELPGIGKETLRLADKLVDAGFAVILPHLFGPLEKTAIGGNLVRVLCMRREFALFSSNKSSPIVDWLRALCRHIRKEYGVSGVGVIGMCLTGNFAITLIGDDSVLAAVAAQPAMPFHKQGALHMSREEIINSRAALDEKGPMLCFRFDGDKLSSATKFKCIQEAFNSDDAERVRLETLPGGSHSVFTLDFVDADGHPTRKALENVIAHFRCRLEA